MHIMYSLKEYINKYVYTYAQKYMYICTMERNQAHIYIDTYLSVEKNVSNSNTCQNYDDTKYHCIASHYDVLIIKCCTICCS